MGGTMPRARTRKRPCKICRRWFLPDSRQIGRQKTCARPECQKELHRQQCQKWNNNHPEYFKANYLNAKLSRTRDPPTVTKKTAASIPPSRIKMGLPTDIVLGVTGAQHLVVLEYIVEQIMQRVVSKASLRPP